ncbi:MAG TPA: response regulator [Pyrinomonadaceae bacterium]|nr:response regulator [Pyrinomonadaceae bacterium]
MKKTLPTTPLDASKIPVQPEQKEEIGAANEPEYLILVVDDSIDNLTMISLDLQQNGYRVATATNGAEALKVAALTNPDLIIMDLAMPEVDGLESTRQIRKDADLKYIPVVAITAFSTEGFRRAAHETGFDGYLTKPIDFSRLHDLIGRLIGLAKSAQGRSSNIEDPN